MIVVTENTPLLEELRGLLIEDSRASPSERSLLAPRIAGLEERIRANVARRLSEIGCEARPVFERQEQAVPPKRSYRADYDALVRLYREAMALAKDISVLKKAMRQRKERGDAA